MLDIQEEDYYPALSCETIGAFIVAIAHQARPFPADLQAKIHELGQQIQVNVQLLQQPIKLIRPLLTTYPSLQSAYDQARIERERNYGELTEFIRRTTTAEIINSFVVVCTAANSIRAARKALMEPGTGLTLSANLLQRIRKL